MNCLSDKDYTTSCVFQCAALEQKNNHIMLSVITFMCVCYGGYDIQQTVTMMMMMTMIDDADNNDDEQL